MKLVYHIILFLSTFFFLFLSRNVYFATSLAWLLRTNHETRSPTLSRFKRFSMLWLYEMKCYGPVNMKPTIIFFVAIISENVIVTAEITVTQSISKN